MKKLAVFSVLISLVSCGGPKTAEFDGQKLVYDSGAWETFDNSGTSGLSLKDDKSCWLDFAQKLTVPDTAREELQSAMEGKTTIYTDKATSQQSYVSFQLGGKTYYGRIGLEESAVCLKNFIELANAN